MDLVTLSFQNELQASPADRIVFNNQYSLNDRVCRVMRACQLRIHRLGLYPYGKPSPCTQTALDLDTSVEKLQEGAAKNQTETGPGL